MATTVVQNSNQAIKISGGGGGVLTSGTTTDFTAPAGGYMIISFVGSTSSQTYSLNGGTTSYAMVANTMYQMYIGSGATIRISVTISNTVQYGYVQFANSLNGA
jgi:hypothetical protein